jgi:hypothetical protein
VEYDLRSAETVSIGVYTPSGVAVRRLSAGHRQPGHYAERLAFGSGISAGMYLIKVTTGMGSSFTKTIMTR